MEFNRSDSYTLCNKLPRLLNEESSYDENSVIIHKTNDYDVVHFSSLYNMSKYNNSTIQECIDAISNDITQPLVIVVNETRFIYDEDYRLSALSEINNYKMQMESNPFTFSGILESCIISDLYNGTYYTDRLLEAVVIPSENPNGKGGTLKSIQNGVDYVTGNTYGFFQKGKNWLSNKVSNFVDDKIQKIGSKVINTLDTPENREKFSNSVGNIAKKSIEKATGAVNDSLDPLKKSLFMGFAGGSALTAIIAGVNKLTNGENMSATGENAANVINTLKSYMGMLQNHQMSAPPQQQGIIARLLSKIKNAIVTLGRKMGL